MGSHQGSKGFTQHKHATWLGVHVGILLLGCYLVPVSSDIVEHFFRVHLKTLNPTCLGDRPSVVVNDQWPGPTIYANTGDLVKVHVFNNQSLGVTIHWHGIEQIGSQWYDGVPGVTQCDIQPGTNFTYIFRIQNQWGTYWWHAHVAQLRNTLHGALIVRAPPNYAEPLGVPIWGEHLFMGGDWYQESPEKLMDMIGKSPFPGYPFPRALHLNGGSLCTSLKFFTVRRLKWYRIRVTNTAMWASFNLKIENHTFVLHEVEGGYTEHMRLSSIDVYPGQSYSLILFTGQRPTNYWIVMNPIYDIENAPRLTRGLGVLSYMSRTNGPVLPTRAFPPGPTRAEKIQNGPVFQGLIRGRHLNQQLPRATITKLLVLEMNQNTQKNQQILYSINNVTFAGSTMPFLQADYLNKTNVYSTTLTPDIPPPGFDKYLDGPSKVGPGVVEVPFGSWVQVVWQNHDTPAGMHPWHLHGYNFWVVAQGVGRFNVARWRRYKYNLRTPVWRNTVTMFNGTWVAIRFQATNPGQWIFHCHLEQHADLGLATVLKVPFPPRKERGGPPPLTAPPPDFPACPK